MIALVSEEAAGVEGSVVAGATCVALGVTTASVALGEADVVMGGIGFMGVVIAPVQPVVRSTAARAAGARALRNVFFNMLLIYQTYFSCVNLVVVWWFKIRRP
jgi:hypothetical protein